MTQPQANQDYTRQTDTNLNPPPTTQVTNTGRSEKLSTAIKPQSQVIGAQDQLASDHRQQTGSKQRTQAQVSSDNEYDSRTKLDRRSACYQDSLSQRDQVIDSQRQVINLLAVLVVFVVTASFIVVWSRLSTTPADVLAKIDQLQAKSYESVLFSAFIESNPEAIIACDEQGIVTHWSDGMTEMSGTPPENAVGLGLASLLMEEDKAGHITGYARVMRSQEPRHRFMHKCKIRNGKGKVVEVVIDARSVPGVGSVATLKLAEPPDKLPDQNEQASLPVSARDTFPVADRLRQTP